MNLLIEPEADKLRSQGERVLVERLYEHLSNWNRPYNTEPWQPMALVEGQRIRDPEWINRDSGTCLDFAVAFATTCVRHLLRPLIALFPPSPTAEIGHAGVVIWGSTSTAALKGEVAPGVWRCTGDTLALPLAQGAAISIDPSLAASDFQCSFAESSAEMDSWLESDEIWLVDVGYLIDTGMIEPLGRPAPSTRPAIGRRLPAMPKYQKMVRDQELIPKVDAIMGEVGTAVLAGEQGIGKSRFAHWLIERRANSCGWFLSASTLESLIESLADAEFAESGGSAESLTFNDRQAEAAVALRRLHTSESSWTIVLDNAGGPSPELLRWFPRPNPLYRQEVLVTTTADHMSAWKQKFPESVLFLSPIDDAQVEALLPTASEDHLALIAGRYVMINALKAFENSVGHLPPISEGTSKIDKPMDGPNWFWAAVKDQVDSNQSVLDAVSEIALLCPITVDAVASRELGLAEPSALLADLGLVVKSANSDITMHRLFSAAVKEERGDEAMTRAARHLLQEPDAVAFLQRRLESEVLDYLKLKTSSDPSTVDDAVALHSLARILELRGKTSESAAAYKRAQPQLEQGGEQFSILVADCLFGRARGVNQHGAADRGAIDEALGWTDDALRRHEDALDRNDPLAVAVGPQRCKAMEGLLKVKLAKKEPIEVRAESLRAALEILRDSEAERTKMLSTGSRETEFQRYQEIARSSFNIAGPHIELAKLETTGGVSSTLDNAAKVYRDVADLRLNKLRLRPGHPHLAASEYGLAAVSYYRAVLQPGETSEDKTAWLRAADSQIRDSLDHRTTFDGQLDGDEAAKCLKLVFKIALARHALAESEGTPTQKINRNSAALVWEAIAEASAGALGPN